MNSISFTPNYNLSVAKQSNNISNKPAFTGLQKAAAVAQPKKTAGIIAKAYKLFFIPFSEKVTSIGNGTVNTVSSTKKGKCITTKQYPLWGKRPTSITRDYPTFQIRENITPKKGDLFDLEIVDRHNPDYKISAGYKDLNTLKNNNKEYSGAMNLTYCDRSVEISDAERVSLIKSFSKSIEEKYASDIQKLLNPETRSLESYNELYSRYKRDPEVIGKAILTSPSALKDQLATINTSMPYGIECIMDKLAK